MRSETGETAASMNSTADDKAWPTIRAALENGATLLRISKLKTYWVTFGNEPVSAMDGGGRLTPTRVKKLESEGVLKHAGVDRYALAQTTT